MAQDEFTFEAEVGKVLDIVIHSLYSNKEIFLRELVSNAADACDKLRYLALTEPGLMEAGSEFNIQLSTNKRDRTVTVADNGIGMNRDELIENLGTIARSGTTAFLESLSGDEKKDSALIGQFGVGFYASFSVAKKVEVLSRKAGEDKAWLWTSEGAGSFTLAEAEREGQGTSVIVHLAKGESEFLEEARIRNIIATYSDHVSIPIMIATKEGENQLNTGSAIWTRARGDITEEQYKEFYHHVGHAFDDPWLTLHNRAEGKIEYTNLLYIPSSKPFDMMNPDRKHRVKLYVKRVFITDDCEELMPAYLRFVRGIVDSEDLPLNVSREMLQHNAVVRRISTALVRRIFSELKKKAEKAPEEYAAFWADFGAVVKEGLYEDADNRERLLEIARFRSTNSDDLISLADYAARMKEGQEEIFFITGADIDQMRVSPQLEGFQSRGLEVLLLDDPVDEFWLPTVGLFEEKPFRSVTAGGIDFSKIKTDDDAGKDEDKDGPEKADAADVAKLILAFKEALGDAVRDVQTSDRLTDSAVCLISGDGDMDFHLERMLKRHGQITAPAAARVLEINPAHALIKKLTAMSGDLTKKDQISETAHLLLDQAYIAEGEPLGDAAGFAQRLSAALERGL
ncbi:MAG: molecular chaperone HtpG [Rhodospirillaceae bacterium]|nr:molecular chaperone HtpG [Rhodospirillaceae bacterium]MBT6860429.1 molecular chaperone HtpG [Rhodospirillaceae bacterium]MBT7031499.1 molecular chaperone HtpG [Rhodospirillaceae bacterium]